MEGKHWYVKVEAALLLGQETLRQNSVKSLRKLYTNESNERVRRALLVPLCNLDANSQITFLREVAFERCPKTSSVASMLLRLWKDLATAQKRIDDLFRDWSESKLLDRFYEIEVIRHSSNESIRQALSRKLRNIRRFVHRPKLRKKIDATLKLITTCSV